MRENIVFTYPNIASFRQRGGLKQRQEALKAINRKYGTRDFQLIEVPADFVKNKTEERKTGKKSRIYAGSKIY